MAVFDDRPNRESVVRKVRRNPPFREDLSTVAED
jgi:hypothetical protein